ncbi:neuroligin-4, X-linked [Eurytemora carolleeae]|uniref:neuroligin-4, X-linked n=1 Tax=Eurytemora carolleeae TaxID=1294199 RepID=UPI000C7916DD|nr:neuroligin-4, X-linked [Eurytemora carolleeae]|eukprot:XP_023324105.1 neuroligin-4, X-linked-like [Eurytemora affinis]
MFPRVYCKMIIFLIIYSLLSVPGHSSYQIVKTKYGSVRGRVESRGTISIKTFKGIPFAAAPVKNLRFMPPVTVSPWKEVLDTNQFQPVCPQDFPEIENTTMALQHISQGRLNYLRRIAPGLKNQSEDCLYLNVYIPISGGAGSRLPVVLLIHGDSYAWGSGNIYDGSALAAFGNILVVTINYRLGVLGFLNVNSMKNGGSTTGVPSNLGILDQIAAMHWIQENIEDFGGDKDNVTVIGHGRGAASLHFLMTSDALPHGMLFRRVILMSGSALAPWARASSPTNTSRALALSLSCPSSPPHLVVECLRKISLSTLLAKSTTSGTRNRFLTDYGPSYDGIVVHSFKNKVGEYLERMARYDMMIGVTSGEGFIFLNHEEMELGLETEGRNRMLSDLVTSSYKIHEKEIFSAILTEYTNWSSTARQPISTRDESVEALTDGLYVSPGVESADYHASLNKNSWFYVFDYQTKYGDFSQRGGCVHGEELAYVLGYPLLGSYYNNYTRAEQNLAELVMTYWTNFIISGNPNFPHIADREGRGRSSGMVDWSPYDPTYKKYLHIGPKMKIKDQFRARNRFIQEYNNFFFKFPRCYVLSIQIVRCKKI